MLITLSPAAQTPTGAQFHAETRQYLAKQQAKILREEKPRAIAGGWETFSIEAEISKERVVMQYYTTRPGIFGATLTARILPAHAAEVQRDVERMAKSLQLMPVK